MKKLSFKTKVLSLALVAGIAAMAGALTLNRSSEQAAAAEETAMFQMENSVRLRLNGNGLAFSAKMDGAKYNEIKNDENKSLYFIVMPSMYLGNVKTADGYNYSAAIVRDSNGVYDKESSHCLYVNASDAIFQNGDEYYALGGVSDVLEENRKLDFVAVACIETKTESGDYTYEYAAYPDGKTQMPVVSQTKTLSKSVLYASTDYSTQINQHYNWFGKGEYALTIATTEDYNALVGKINGGAALGDMELRINSGVDKTQATLNEGLALPATQTKFSTVKFYDDDGTTLLASADVNDGKNVTPTTPAKAATEEFSYTFDKWVTEKGGDVAASFENITENTSVYAKWVETKNKYTVKWVVDGITVKEEQVEYGVIPSFGSEDPAKADDKKATYTFAGWDNEVIAVKNDVTYTAVFNRNVRPYYAFIDMSESSDLALFSGEKYDPADSYADSYTTGCVIEKTYGSDEVIGGYFETTVNHDGAMLRINYQTGLKDGRAYFNDKLSDHDKVVFYIYSPISNVTLRFMRGDWGFSIATQVLSSGWNLVVIDKQNFVDGSGTYEDGSIKYGLYLMLHDNGALNGKTVRFSSFYAYTEAGYESRNYTVTFKNGDEILQTGKVFHGLTPAYSGDTPVKAADENYTYTFSGWDKEISPATGDVEYIAQFNSQKIYQQMKIVGHFYDGGQTRIFKTDIDLAGLGITEGDPMSGKVTVSNGTADVGLKYVTITSFTAYNLNGTGVLGIGFNASLGGADVVTFAKGVIFTVNGYEYEIAQDYAAYYQGENSYAEKTVKSFNFVSNTTHENFMTSLPKDAVAAWTLHYTQATLIRDGVESKIWVRFEWSNSGDNMVVGLQYKDGEWKDGDILWFEKNTMLSYWSSVEKLEEECYLTRVSASVWTVTKGSPKK